MENISETRPLKPAAINDHDSTDRRNTDHKSTKHPLALIESTASKLQQADFALLKNIGKASLARRAILAPRPSKEEFIGATSERDREVIRLEVNCAVLQFLEQERRVHLDGLGFLIPKRKKRSRVDVSDDYGVIRQEVIRDVEFEKCDDPDSFKDLSSMAAPAVAAPAVAAPAVAAPAVAAQEFCERIYGKMPLSLQVKWSELDFKRLLRGFFRMLRDDLLETGLSDHLSAVGALYALHNRQGQTAHDWFAGADVLIVARHEKTISLGKPTLFYRPVLSGPFEFLAACYGKLLASYPLHLNSLNQRNSKKETTAEDTNSFYAAFSGKSPLASFTEQVKDGIGTVGVSAGKAGLNSPFIVLCSSLLSFAGLNGYFGRQTALVSHIDLAGDQQSPELLQTFLGGRKVIAPIEGALSIHKIMACAIDSIQNALPKKLRGTSPQGVCSCKLTEQAFGPRSKLGAILLSPSWLSTVEHRYSAAIENGSQNTDELRLAGGLSLDSPLEGQFQFAGMLGITEDEHSFAERRGASHLLALLRRKGWAQVTNPLRSSVFQKTVMKLAQ